MALLDDLPPDLPLLLLATAKLPTADPAAAAAALSSSSSRLLTAPGAAAADAAGSSKQQRKQQQREHLEQLGMDPTLAALFPPLGQISDVQSLVDGLQQQAGLLDMQQQQQQRLQAGDGSDVLGWVLLGQPGPDERRRMFKVRCVHSGWAVSTICRIHASYTHPSKPRVHVWPRRRQIGMMPAAGIHKHPFEPIAGCTLARRVSLMQQQPRRYLTTTAPSSRRPQSCRQHQMLQQQPRRSARRQRRQQLVWRTRKTRRCCGL